MSPTVDVIVPWRENPDRVRQFLVAGNWLPAGQLVIADDPGERFNRGRAVNAAVADSRGQVLAIADSDLIVPGWAWGHAIGVAEQDGAGLVVPFSTRMELSEAATADVLTGKRHWFGPWAADDIDLEMRSVGGANVVSRRGFETVGGFDPRFDGWGGEDAAFDLACSTLLGPTRFVPAVAVHLWHPHDRGTDDQRDTNMALVALYEAAYGEPERMRRLVER